MNNSFLSKQTLSYISMIFINGKVELEGKDNATHCPLLTIQHEK